MSNSERKIALPKRKFEDATDKFKLQRIAKRSNLGLVEKVERVLGDDFKKIEDSFMGPIIKMARRQEKMVFSRHLTHHLLLRRIELGDKSLWFSFGEQPMRFSLREFHLTTGLPCVVEGQVETPRSKKKKDPWMTKNETLNSLIKLFEKNSSDFTANQRLRLGATILVEGILMAINPVTRIPEENLVRASNFKEYCKYPWGNIAYDFLRKEIKGFNIKTLQKEQYGICGFINAVHLWALSSVDELEKYYFGIKDPETEYPLCLHWIETKSLTMEEVIRFDTNEKVDVKCIIGDPELHGNLVEEVVDNEFGRVLDLVMRGYRLKKQDWVNGSVNIDVAEAEIEQKNPAPGIDASDKEKIEFLTKMLVILQNKVKHLETILKIGQETANGQNDQPKFSDAEVLQSFVNAIRQVLLF